MGLARHALVLLAAFGALSAISGNVINATEHRAISLNALETLPAPDATPKNVDGDGQQVERVPREETHQAALVKRSSISDVLNSMSEKGE